MEIDRLYYLQAIVQEGTYSKAAYALNLSQSALSKQILKLEAELGITIFDRSKRQIALTAAGQRIYEDSLKVTKDYETLVNHANKERQSQQGLSIGILPIYSQFGIGKQILDFQSEHPELKVSVNEMEERDLDGILRNKPYDVYILRGDFLSLKNYQRMEIYQDELVAVMNEEHPLSHRKSLSFEDLEHEPLSMFPIFTQIRKASEDACRKAGYVPNVIHSGRENTLLYFARDNDGIALMMMESLRTQDLSGLSILKFKDPVKTSIYLYYQLQQKNQKAIEAFIQAFRH